MPREQLLNTVCKASIDGLNTPLQVMSATVTLGMDARASSCSITIDDTGNKVAAQLIDLTLTAGGIIGIPEPKPQPSASTGVLPGNLVGQGNSGVVEGIIAQCNSVGISAPHQVAFVLAVAQGESNFDHNAYNPEGGAYGQYGGRGLGQITHDYNYKTMGDLLGVDLLGNPELAHREDISTAVLVRGVQRGWTGQGGLSQWMADSTSSRETAYKKIQGGVWGTRYETFYQQWLQKLGTYAATASTTNPAPAPEGTPNLNTEESEENLKGRVIKVQLGFETGNLITYEFIHVKTTTSEVGKTTIEGQSIRWLLRRSPKQNTAYVNISLHELAAKVCKRHGLQLQMKETGPDLEYVDQTGITDYTLLRRECSHHGYQIKESGAALVIEKLGENKRAPKQLIYRETVSTWTITDAAANSLQDAPNLAGQGGTEVSASTEAKQELDAETGTMVEKQSSKKPTEGDQAPAATATVKGAGTSPLERERTRRVKGLPAMFQSDTEPHFLRFEPGDALVTQRFPEAVFNRAWVLDSVTHTFAGSLRTELSVYTPVTVIDTRPLEPVAQGGIQGQLGTVTPSGWAWPTDGVETSGFMTRRRPRHFGVDISGSSTDDLLAAASGRVEIVAFDAGGYGWWVSVRRPDGWSYRMGHFAQRPSVSVGQVVNIGDYIGIQGSTGRSTGKHLHFEVRNPSGNPVNPHSVMPPL